MNKNTPTLITDLGMLPLNSIRKDTGNRAYKRYGIYQCPKCDDTFKAQATMVKNNRSTQCRKCGIKEIAIKISTHGSTNTRLYKIYSGMKTRVLNPNRNCSKNYIQRGISICEEWETFIPFQTWANNNGYTDSLTIDRIDNDGNYEPANCRWVSMVIQSQNKRLLQSSNTSGFAGVSKASKGKSWVARISNNCEHILLGVFKHKLDAVLARDSYIISNKLHHTRNFPSDTVEELTNIISTYKAKYKELDI